MVYFRVNVIKDFKWEGKLVHERDLIDIPARDFIPLRRKGVVETILQAFDKKVTPAVVESEKKETAVKGRKAVKHEQRSA